MKAVSDPEHPLAAVALAIEEAANARGWDGGDPFTFFNLYRQDDGFVLAKPIPAVRAGRMPDQLEVIADAYTRNAAMYREDFASHPGETLHGFMVEFEAWVIDGTEEEVATGLTARRPREHPDRVETRLVFAISVDDECARVWRRRKKGEHEPVLATDVEWSGRVERLVRMIVRRQRWLVGGAHAR